LPAFGEEIGFCAVVEFDFVGFVEAEIKKLLIAEIVDIFVEPLTYIAGDFVDAGDGG